MRKTKLLALLLVVAMIASMVVPSVYAEEPYTISIVDNSTGASTINANAGDTVTLALKIANNPGINGVAVNIGRPEGWTTKRPTDKNLFSETASVTPTFSQTTNDNPYFVSWLMAYGTFENEDAGTLDMQLCKDNGVLATVKITIPETATTGTYQITLDMNGLAKGNYCEVVDGNGVMVPNQEAILLTPVLENLTVNVQGNEPAGAACPEHTDVTTWTEVAENEWAAGGALTSGHYKLMGNQATTAALTVAEGESVCIDLNGFNITAGAKAAASSVSYRVFTNQGTLAILDTTAAGEGENYTAGKISGGALKEQGNSGDHTTLAACGGNIYNSGTFTLVDGIIADGYLNGGAYDSVDKGGNIFSENGTLNIKGGWIKGGQNKRTSQNGTESAYTGGGNISAVSTDVNITGGMITGGKVYGTYNYSNTTARKSYLYGGNICVSGGSLDIANATIAGGTVEYTLTSKKSTVINYAYGGNIFVTGVSDVSIVNSTISGGQVKAYSTGSSSCTVKAQGGNIWMKMSAATSKMTVDATSVITGGLTNGTSGSHADAATAVASPSLNYRGGNIYIEKGTLDIHGEISNGTGQRGSIFTPGNATINVYEGANLYGSKSVDYYGHEITITAQSGNLNVYGGTITTAESDGAAVYALYANVNISGGTIENTNTGFSIMTYSATSSGFTVINQTGGTVSGKIKLDKDCQLNVTGGTINIPSISGTGTLSVGAGVTSVKNPEAYLTGCVAYNYTGEFYVTYADLTAALAAATSGNQVILVADATVTEVDLVPGVTLDLNGNKLTAEAFSAGFEGSHVIDSVGTGVLVADSTSFAESNNQLPIKTEDGYVFETVEFAENLSVDTTATYKFYIKSEAAKTAIDEAIVNGGAAEIRVYVTWTNANGESKNQTFRLTDATLLAQLANNWDTKMVVLTINDLTGVSDLTCTAQVVANDVVVSAS